MFSYVEQSVSFGVAVRQGGFPWWRWLIMPFKSPCLTRRKISELSGIIAQNDSLGLREKKPSFVNLWKNEAGILICRSVLFGMKLTVPSKISSTSWSGFLFKIFFFQHDLHFPSILVLWLGRIQLPHLCRNSGTLFCDSAVFQKLCLHRGKLVQKNQQSCSTWKLSNWPTLFIDRNTPGNLAACWDRDSARNILILRRIPDQPIDLASVFLFHESQVISPP